MSADAHSSSTNPFRRKSSGPITSPPLAIKPPYDTNVAFFDDGDAFAPPKSPDAASSIPTPATHPERNPANDASNSKTKLVKRVRVQTPPPLSPDTEPSTPTSLLAASAPARSGGGDDPFDNAGSSASDTDEEPSRQAGPPPRNPFSRTLHDVERSHLKDAHPVEEKERRTSKASRASLDVEAFHRLLLTGQAPSSAHHQPSPTASSPGEDPNITLLPQSPPELGHERTVEPASFESPRDSQDLDIYHDDRASLRSESSAAPLSPPLKKKPPPPSSRHGRLIKLELGASEASSTSKRTSVIKPPPPVRRPSDPNKPLPPAPVRKPSEESSESIFDVEAAGKVPEVPGPPSPAASVQEQPGVIKRPTPAPPPRRAKTDSNIHDHGTGVTGPPVNTAQLQRRPPSSESLRSRAESIRHSAPAPPPPRRPAAGHRSTGSIASPSSQSFTHSPLTSPLGITEATQHPATSLHQRIHSATDAENPLPTLIPTNQKLAPPRPPTRNPSTRRQQSISGIEGAGKRPPTRDKDLVPPPPPRRQRGGSRSSIDTPPGNSRRSSVDDGRRGLHPAPHAAVDTLREVDENVQPAQNRLAGKTSGGKGSGLGEGEDDGTADSGQGGAILADLDALRREVDALKQRYASEASQNPG